MKYLEDTEGVFGDGETINTMFRQVLQDDMPEADQILDNFVWEVEDMESVMAEINDGADPQTAAQAWIEENQETVDQWLAVEE